MCCVRGVLRIVRCSRHASRRRVRGDGGLGARAFSAEGAGRRIERRPSAEPSRTRRPTERARAARASVAATSGEQQRLDGGRPSSRRGHWRVTAQRSTAQETRRVQRRRRRQEPASSSCDESAMPSGDESTPPSGDESTTPSDNGGDESAMPSCDEPPTLSDGMLTTPSGDKSTTPSGDEPRRRPEPPLRGPHCAEQRPRRRCSARARRAASPRRTRPLRAPPIAATPRAW